MTLLMFGDVLSILQSVWRHPWILPKIEHIFPKRTAETFPQAKCFKTHVLPTKNIFVQIFFFSKFSRVGIFPLIKFLEVGVARSKGLKI